MSVRQQVEEFHAAIGESRPSGIQAAPSRACMERRANLVTEEFFEFLEAIDPDGQSRYAGMLRELRERFSQASFANVDLVETVDALADLDYVIEGTRFELGIDGGPIAAEVHRSNMAKIDPEKGVMVRDARIGKVVKPPTWTPPDIAGELRKQGWRP